MPVSRFDDLLASGRRLGWRFYRKALGPVFASNDQVQMALGRMATRVMLNSQVQTLEDAEFQVFSQWSEDGIIQYLTSVVPIPRRWFIEFGVADYREANTRFLLQKDRWRGLIIDGGSEHTDFLQRSWLRWRHTIDGKTAFLTRENINQVIGSAGMEGDIGLLSVDVDGNDYWLLDALTCVSPRILVVEYNSLFGATAAVTVPYDPSFDRASAHWSQLFYGASLAALARVANARGLALVGCESAGVNAFFVRRDLLGPLRERSVVDAYVARQHREARDRRGRLSYLSDARSQLQLMADMELVDVTSGERVTVSNLLAGDPST